MTTADVHNASDLEPATAPAPKGAPHPEWTDSVPRAPVSIVVLTLNEEINIVDCLASCAWCDDVHVLDSGSQDRTLEYSQAAGADTHVHSFESFGKQRNWAIENIPLKHDWVFHLDADERFTPELVREIDELLKSEPSQDGFHVPHKLMFMGKWLKRAGGYPTYQMRLFHKLRMRFIDYGHGQREETGSSVGTLDEPYLHYVFSKGVYDWLDKHNRYSSLEALQVIEAPHEKLRFRGLIARDPIVRRRSWKEFSYRMPFRPFARWFVMMFLLGGVIEGKPAWTYIRLLTMYEQMIGTKMRLLRRHHAGQSKFEQDEKPSVSTRIHDAGDRDLDSSGTPLAPPDVQPKPQLVTDDEGMVIPEASPWSLKEKIFRAVWMVIGRPVFRLSFHNWYGFRARLLRLFGAKVGKGVSIRPSANIEIPWNIELHDGATIGDHAILYSLGKITIGARTIVSQYAHLCAGTHDHTDRRFPLIRDPISIGSDAWIGADAFIGPNVTIGRLAVIGARSSAYADLDPETVYVGNPCRPLKKRELV